MSVEKVPLEDYIDYLEMELQYHRDIKSSKDVIKQFLTKLVKAKKAYNDDPNGVVTEKLVNKNRLKRLAANLAAKSIKIAKHFEARDRARARAREREFNRELATGVHDKSLFELMGYLTGKLAALKQEEQELTDLLRKTELEDD